MRRAVTVVCRSGLYIGASDSYCSLPIGTAHRCVGQLLSSAYRSCTVVCQTVPIVYLSRLHIGASDSYYISSAYRGCTSVCRTITIVWLSGLHISASDNYYRLPIRVAHRCVGRLLSSGYRGYILVRVTVTIVCLSMMHISASDNCIGVSVDCHAYSACIMVAHRCMSR